MKRLGLVSIWLVLTPAALADEAKPTAPAKPNLFPAEALSAAAPSSAGKPVDRAVAGRPLDARTPAPVWRDAERRIERAFSPSGNMLGRDSRAALLTTQVAKARPSAPAGVELPNKPADEAIDDQVLAAQVAREQPAKWYETQIEVSVGADGRLVDAHVSAASGSSRLDEAALGAVRAALAQRPTRDPHGAVIAVFRVGAARVVQPLHVNPVLAPGTRRFAGLAPQMSFRVEETTGRVTPKTPLAERVSTRVHLESIALAMPP